MRIVYFANARVGLDVLRFLNEAREQVVGLVLHPPEHRSLGDELIAESGLQADRIFDATMLSDPQTVDALAALDADVGLSALFGFILKPDVLSLFPRGVLNVHPGYLPFNRGRNAQVWGIVEHTPVGATLHYMDAGVDTGPIVERVHVPIEDIDTGETLRAKLERACVEVTRAGWPAVLEDRAPSPQDRAEGTRHLVSDLETIERIDPDAMVRAGDLIDRLRALTSPPQSRGAYIERDGRRIYLTLSLSEDPTKAG